MSDFGKMLALAGVALIAAGLLLWWGGRLGLGRLPGDIRVEHGNFRLYLPLATCLLLSAVLTLVLWLLRRR